MQRPWMTDGPLDPILSHDGSSVRELNVSVYGGDVPIPPSLYQLREIP